MGKKSGVRIIALFMALLMMVTSFDVSVFALEIKDETVVIDTGDIDKDVVIVDETGNSEKDKSDVSVYDEAATSKDEEMDDSSNNGIVSTVNPAFDKKVSKKEIRSWEDDLKVGSKSTGNNSAAVENFEFFPQNEDASFEGAVACVKENAINRNRFFTVQYVQEGEYKDAGYVLPFEILDAAFEEGNDVNYRDGDYLKAHYIGVSTYTSCVLPADEDSNEYKYIIKYNLQMTSSADQEKVVDRRVSEIISSLKLVNKTDYEKIKAIYDYVADTTKYHREAANKGAGYLNGKYLSAWSAYGALCQRQAVCQGYAGAINRLLNEAGIECKYVTGYAGEEHAWNIVKLNGAYYNLDATWDADNDTVINHKSTNDWFLMSDNDFVAHERDEEYDSKEFRKAYRMAKKSYSYVPKWEIIKQDNIENQLYVTDGNEISTASNGKVKVMIFADCENVRGKMLLRGLAKKTVSGNSLVDVIYVDNKYTKESVDLFLESNNFKNIIGCYNGEDGLDNVTPVLEQYVTIDGEVDTYTVPTVVIVDADNIVRLATFERISVNDICKIVNKCIKVKKNKEIKHKKESAKKRGN